MIILFCGLQSKAQTDSSNPFDFEYSWGFYSHNKVSSKESKVYVAIRHGTYADTSIIFTREEKKEIWESLQEINIMDFPEKVDCCDFDDTLEYEYDVLYMFDIDSLTGEIDSVTDTIWYVRLIECFEETAGPYNENILTIFYQGKSKTIELTGPTPYYEENGKRIYLHNSQCVKLRRIFRHIEKLTESKRGFKNLPESKVMYY